MISTKQILEEMNILEEDLEEIFNKNPLQPKDIFRIVRHLFFGFCEQKTITERLVKHLRMKVEPEKPFFVHFIDSLGVGRHLNTNFIIGFHRSKEQKGLLEIVLSNNAVLFAKMTPEEFINRVLACYAQ